MRILRAGIAAICAAGLFPAAALAGAPAISQYPLPSGGAPGAGAVGADGNLWFAETLGNKIARMTPSGSATEFTIPTFATLPAGVVPGADGNIWFVEAGTNAVAKITTSGAITEYAVPSAGSHPFDAAAGPDGNVWFTEFATDKVGRITPSGSFTEFSLSSGAAPEGIATGPDGNIWVAESGAGKVAKLSPSGVTLASYATSGAPLNVTAGPDGAVWFTEQLGNRIGRVTTGGSVTEFASPTSSSGPFGIAAGPDGAIWFTEQFAGRIGRITTDGTQIADWSLGASGPEELAAGPDGRMWVPDSGSGAVSAVKMLAPAATTVAPPSVAATAATLAGTVNPNGLPTSYSFEYGPTAAYGASTPSWTANGVAAQPVSAPVALAPGAVYHYRLVASNASGSSYGPDQTFATPQASPAGGASPTAAPPDGTAPPPPAPPGTSPTGVGISVATKVVISTAPVTVSARGDVVLEIDCPASATAGCRGTVTLRAAGATAPRARVVASRCARGCRPLGRGNYQATAGTRGHVRIHLAGFARAELARRGSMRVAVTVATGSGAHVKTTTRTITLRAPRRRR